jgi:two-component system chemotaxis sensor kinase CheA
MTQIIPPHDPADIFRQEATELLEQLETALLDLEQDPAGRALIDTAFRALHTIKGSGSMFGFDHVAGFAHRFETVFDRIRNGEAAVDHRLIAVALAAKDHIRLQIEQPDDTRNADGERILDDLRALIDEPAETAAALPPPSAAPDDGRQTWRVRFRLPKDVLVTGTNPLFLLDELRSLGTCTVVALTDQLPLLDEIDADACYFAWDVVLTTDHPRTAIDDVFLFVLDDMELSVERIEAPLRLGEILVERGDVTPDAVQEAAASQPRIGEILVRSGAASPDSVQSALAEQRHTRRESESARGENGGEGAREPVGRDTSGKGNSSLRVPAERLDELMDRVGELVIVQARLTQLAGVNGDANIKAVAEEMERLASGLRDITMGIRMVTIGSLFGRFRRLVRDLSQELGKDVELATLGEETELDKTVIERLADPLVHIIRNAIDHGLEDGAGRLAAGKPVRGTIRLTARHAGADVVITIADDGRGLDRDRIRAKAEDQGLLSPDVRLSDSELLQLLFVPGFSTAREITSVSGRGVGMDVVKRTIESLRGGIELTSTPGEGTVVTLRLPLTLAIIDGLLVRVGAGRYVIPLSAVEECVELSTADDLRSTGRSFLNIRGDLVPFLRLRELFNSGAAPAPHQKVVIVSTGDLRVGLVVDQIVGHHQTVIKSLSKLHADVQTFSGATILGDGTVALILDIAHLVEARQAHEERLKAS